VYALLAAETLCLLLCTCLYNCCVIKRRALHYRNVALGRVTLDEMCIQAECSIHCKPAATVTHATSHQSSDGISDIVVPSDACDLLPAREPPAASCIEPLSSGGSCAALCECLRAAAAVAASRF
jgi:hypothetical protein